MLLGKFNMDHYNVFTYILYSEYLGEIWEQICFLGSTHRAAQQCPQVVD
jgi:hypothetical protein